MFLSAMVDQMRGSLNGLALAQRAVDSKILETIRSEIQERINPGSNRVK